MKVPKIYQAIVAIGLLLLSLYCWPRLVGRFVTVDGNSMAPTLCNLDVCRERPLNRNDLERGTIVVIKDNDGCWAVKRIIGLPGETVTFRRGEVLINHHRLNEPYLKPDVNTFPDYTGKYDVMKLGPSQYVVLGDNRQGSLDSRKYGPIKTSQIDGVVDVKVLRPTAEDRLAAATR